MSWVEIVSAVLGLVTVFLAGRGLKYNFWVGYVYNIFLGVLCVQSHLYSALVLCGFSFAISVLGHYRWTHPREDERSAANPSELKVSKVDPKHWSALVLIVLAAGAAWAMFLEEKTPDSNPWLGSYVMMLTFLAQYLSAQKNWECWIVWLIVNVCNIALYISVGRYIMAATYGLYFINGAWSMASWIRKFKRNV